jgi:Helix-turn-helix of insertion element transposase
VSSLTVVPNHVGTSLIKFPKGTIGPQFVDKAMPWFESFWHRMNRYPQPDEIMGHFKFTLEQIELLNLSPYWEKCCESRGIRLPKQNQLNATQIATISLITNFSDRRSIPAKIAAIGVTEEQLNGWYKDKEFQQELAIRTDANLDNTFPEVQASLIRQVQKGNFQAIKFYYEITGRAVAPEQLQVKQTMQHLIEAVQKHVQDPETLKAIAQEVRLLGELH